jgi:AcrR family transcriptional regulator
MKAMQTKRNVANRPGTEAGDADLTPARRRGMSKAERSARSDAEIMRAAARLIARQGYGKTSLIQIGLEAGYSGALISSRFGSKEGLLRALLEHIKTRFNDDQIRPALAGRKGLEALCAVMDAYLRELKERVDRVRIFYVLMGEGLGSVPEVLPSFSRLNESLRADAEQRIREGIDAGEIRPDLDPKVEAVAFLAALRGTALQWLVDHESFDLDHVRRGLVASLRRNLGVEGSDVRRRRSSRGRGR